MIALSPGGSGAIPGGNGINGSGVAFDSSPLGEGNALGVDSAFGVPSGSARAAGVGDGATVTLGRFGS